MWLGLQRLAEPSVHEKVEHVEPGRIILKINVWQQFMLTIHLHTLWPAIHIEGIYPIEVCTQRHI